MRRTASLPLAAILAALLIAGCGDKQEPSAVAELQGGAQRATEDPAGPPDRGNGRPDAANEEKGAAADSVDQVSYRGTTPAPTASGSLPNEGTKKVAPGVPTTTGGDNSIQEYGVEAPRSQRIEAAGVLKAYLDARAGGRWAEACSVLSEGIHVTLKHLNELAEREGRKVDASCAAALRKLSSRIPRPVLRRGAAITVLSMRVESGRAFLIYDDGADRTLQIPMAEKSGLWTVSGLEGTPLVP